MVRAFRRLRARLPQGERGGVGARDPAGDIAVPQYAHDCSAWRDRQTR
jgi:hypothetical protein